MAKTTIPAAAFLYWLVAGAFIVFGYLGLISIGAPFLGLGLAMALLAPYRTRTTIFWPPIAGIVFFFVAYIVIAPLGCSVTATPILETPGIEAVSQVDIGLTTCDRVLLPDYTGKGQPALWPSTIAAAAIGLMEAITTRYLLRRRAGDPV